MPFTGLQQDYLGGGLAAARPSAATLGPTIPPGSCAFYFATDTNVLYRLAGGDVAWQVATGGGGGAGNYTLLTTLSGTALASFDLATRNAPGQAGDLFQADFNNYQMFVELMNNTNSQNILVRLSTNGGASYDSGANYTYNSMVAGGGIAVENNGGATSIPLCYTGAVSENTANLPLRSEIEIINPFGTTYYKTLQGKTSYWNGGQPVAHYPHGIYRNLASVNALQVLAGAGTVTGSVRVYGLTK